jgi:hypothetical protein
MAQLTFSPDPPHLAAGAGTAAAQAAQPRGYAAASGYGWQDTLPVPATGATAGTPGNFTPAGCFTPANLAAMAGLNAVPALAWSTGQYVQPADGSDAHWSGTAWVVGTAP